MARIPNITVHSWHAEGPAYTIHNRLDGRRNRRARASGGGDQVVGDPDSPESSEAAGYLAYTRGDDEVWAFNKGHVYELELLVDGADSVILVDAREDYVLQRFTHEVQLLGRRALTEDELAELLEGVETSLEETPAEEAPEPEAPAASHAPEPTEEELEALTAPHETSGDGDGETVGGDVAPAAPEDE